VFSEQYQEAELSTLCALVLTGLPTLLNLALKDIFSTSNCKLSYKFIVSGEKKAVSDAL